MRVRFYISYYQLKKIKALTEWLLSMFCLYLQSGIWNNHLWQFMSNGSSIALVTFFLYRLKAREDDSNMLVQQYPTCWIKIAGWCWTNIFFVKMSDESLNQFKHSSNIFSFFSCWIVVGGFPAHVTCWTNILERKMSISIKFERLNVRMPIPIYCLFGQFFLSFSKMNSQKGETVE